MQETSVNTNASTRQKLLEAAERLFLESGYEGVSVRDLTEAAGVNVAAINYHFSGKKNLYREVFGKMLARVTARRLNHLGELLKEGETPNLKIFIRTYVSSVLGDLFASRDAERRLHLISAEMAEDAVAQDVLIREMAVPLSRMLHHAIKRSRPELPDQKIVLCIGSLVGQMFHFIQAKSLISRLMERDYDRDFIEEIIDHITEFTLKGIGDKREE